MSNESGSNNRNKVLFGFGAVVAVLVAAILLWPSNVRKEDASGAIGAVQKHHAPQITQQDVILGGEQVKAQQKVLYTDFREDASKLRSLAANRNDAAMRSYDRELSMRASRVANEAAETAARMNNAKIAADVVELNAMFARGLASDEQVQAFNKQLGIVSEELDSKAQFARLSDVGEQLNHISLADEQAASRALKDLEVSLSNFDYSRTVSADVDYLAMMQAESRALARSTADELQAAASRLEAKAQANEDVFVAQETQLSSRLSEIDAALGTRFNSASMVNNQALAEAEAQVASRVQVREAAARTFSRLDARSQ